MSETNRRLTFASRGGATLAAALDLPAGAPRAYALFAHCFSCSKDIRAAREIARALRAAGFGVLRFDFTGLGASEGDFSDTNFSSNVDDLIAAADFLRDEFEAPSILIGHSLGGAAAIVAGGRIPEIKGVAVIGAPAEAAHVAHQFGAHRDEILREGEASLPLAGRDFVIRKQFLDDVEDADVLGAAARLGRPLLILHAPLDQTVGIENAGRLFGAARHPKSFVSLDAADHLLSDPADARYAAGIIAAWAARYIVRPDADDKPAADAFAGGARARTMAGRRYAVEMSIDGRPFVIDVDPADGGDGLGPNPTRVVEAALAACSAITMRMYAERKGWPAAGVSVDVISAGGGAHQARVFEKTIAIEGPLDDDQRRRMVEIAERCPVRRMLAGGVAFTTRLLPQED